MAETPLKRQREETQVEEEEEHSKRHKSYNHILSLLEADEEEPTQDLSSLITTLQQELSSDSSFDPVQCPASEADPENSTTASATLECTSSSTSSSPSSSATVVLKEGQEDDREGFIRHLLEASDDELGIPNSEVRLDEGGYGFHEGDLWCLGNGLWELEDEAANYYTLLQSELFM